MCVCACVRTCALSHLSIGTCSVCNFCLGKDDPFFTSHVYGNVTQCIWLCVTLPDAAENRLKVRLLKIPFILSPLRLVKVKEISLILTGHYFIVNSLVAKLA